ncbi:selenocysteine-specific elongation factor [Galendromus occidentalis]|uniref:Selenocysteine-specific elongation factor n=1 Tax=Galendromus occidentalis TaxID=34638 RepID=A0AAJ6QRB0_9ACAR|nr:selenocysteine-specific elongation factor [Galendromus occidentalis]
MVNVNVGVLGHVDSGKTSLCRALSHKGSTAAFDKNPQSQRRGITLDLGFSTFSHSGPHGETQYTLVDCPGHASLVKTVIGGAQIIDVMLLVIDVTKGVQTQTAECLIIGEICCDRMLIVLNKLDLLDGGPAALEKIKTRMRKTLELTKFKDSEMIAISANPQEAGPVGIDELKDLIAKSVPIPQRSRDGPFVLCVDHCFQIKGQGTVLTGTVTQGMVSVNSLIEIPLLKLQRKVKSMQVFGQPVTEAIQGDRVGICVTQFEANLFERGVVCSPNHFQLTYAVLVPVLRIAYFRNSIRSGTKFHLTSIHDTVLGKQTFFSGSERSSIEQEFVFEEELAHNADGKFFFALIEFDQPMICGVRSLVLGSKLDTDINTKTCRLAYHGKVAKTFVSPDYKKSLAALRVSKTKHKTGVVDRVPNESEVIVKNLFKKETNLEIFSGMKVAFSSGETGAIQSSFGQSGKVKIQLDVDSKISADLKRLLKAKKGEKPEGDPITVTLTFKRLVFDPSKKAIQ